MHSGKPLPVAMFGNRYSKVTGWCLQCPEPQLLLSPVAQVLLPTVCVESQLADADMSVHHSLSLHQNFCRALLTWQ